VSETTTTEPLRPAFLTVPEFAAVLAVSERTAWAIVADGDIETVLIRRCRRVPADAAERYIDRLRAAS